MLTLQLSERSPFFRNLVALLAALLAVLLAILASASLVRAQDAWAGGKAVVVRTVQLPSGGAPPEVVVTEFYTQGELRPDARNLAVSHEGRPVPWRLLQVGPGDFCRVAFRTVRGGKVYKICYGGPAPEKKSPPWTNTPGLLLETHRWRGCDFNRLDSVRQALAAGELIGSDYVRKVWHRCNPFSPGPEPFFSIYRGALQIDKAGKYLFFTSSQDCSFLLIDGKQVVAAPGWHGPVGDARIKGEINLTAGPHRFEYYHAAAGDYACMVAAWQPPGATKPSVIPARAFGHDAVAHLNAGLARHRTWGTLPDFDVEVLGEVPLEDVNEPLQRVQFTANTGARGARVLWDFGDGQTSEQSDPVHVYAYPGMYTVQLSVRGGMKVQTAVNRVWVHRALVLPTAKRPIDKLTDYLRIFQRYDSTRMPVKPLLQFVRAYEQLGQEARAARLGRACLLSDRAKEDEEAAHALVQRIGPLLRDRLDDPAGALAVWKAVAGAIRREEWKAECELQAIDISLHDLLQRAETKALLDSATTRLAKLDQPALSSRLYRLWGDWRARNGDRKAARSAYALAEGCLASRDESAVQNAWRGALSRSTEAFLREKQLDRALAELRRWQERFPADRAEGYLPLLWARYHAARGKYRQAIAAADDLVQINPDSPHADRLVFLAAECAEKLGQTARARAGYQALLTDYPGSPLVKEARENLSRLQEAREAERKPQPKK
jgi:TolA-binding protein